MQKILHLLYSLFSSVRKNNVICHFQFSTKFLVVFVPFLVLNVFRSLCDHHGETLYLIQIYNLTSKAGNDGVCGRWSTSVQKACIISIYLR